MPSSFLTCKLRYTLYLLIYNLKRVHSLASVLANTRKSILKKIKELEDDGLGEDEAIKSAITYREHAINNLIPEL